MIYAVLMSDLICIMYLDAYLKDPQLLGEFHSNWLAGWSIVIIVFSVAYATILLIDAMAGDK